jgi:N-acylneuraminate cytidylyltransferase
MIFFIIIKKKSQRVKNKNFIKLGSKELWKHLVLELKGEKVFIDTDSNRIIKECRRCFPWVVAYPRKKEHIKFEERKTISPALLMIDNFLKKYVESNNEIIVTTHVTSPFVKLSTIKKAAKKLKKYDSVAAVTKYYNFAWLKNKKNKLIPINFNPKEVNKTQNLNPIVMSNGAFFIFKKKTFIKYNNRIGKNPFYYELNFPESVEIDDKEDLYLARNICR